MPGLFWLHLAYAVSVFLFLVNQNLEGSKKIQIGTVLGWIVLGLLVWIWIGHGFGEAVFAFILTFGYFAVLRGPAHWVSDAIFGRHSVPRIGPELKRVSEALNPEDALETLHAGGVEAVFARSQRQEEAREALFDLCRSQTGTREVLEQYQATDAELEEGYKGLMASGCGQKVGEHLIAASALAYPDTLQRVLEETRSPEPTWEELCVEMLERFGAFSKR